MEPDFIGGNYFNKYESKNPLVKLLMWNFLRHFDALCARTKATRVFEYGCGEGYLSLRMLQRGLQVRGADVDERVVDQANAAAKAQGFGELFFVEDVTCAPAKIRGELVVCCEVLEHVREPEAALERLGTVSSEWVLFSVPYEPVFRLMNMLRFKYLKDFGNTPGHIQHWSARSFAAMVGKHFEIVEQRVSLPWVFLLCRKRGL